MAMITSQSSLLTEEHLAKFKSYYPQNARLQAVTLEELLHNTRAVTLDHIVAPGGGGDGFDVAVVTMSAATPSGPSCGEAVATVVFDAIMLVTGAVALRNAIVKPVVKELTKVGVFAGSKIGQIITRMAAKNASKTDLAHGFIAILKEIHDAELFDKIWDAISKSLTWYYAILYGVVVIATIATLVTSGGTLLVAEFVLLLTSCVFMAFDIATAVTSCGLIAPDLPSPAPDVPPAPNTDPYVTEPHGGLMTSDGWYLTFTNGGNVVAAGWSIDTNANSVGPDETFTLVPVYPPGSQDAVDQGYPFMIKASNGVFLTVANNGGNGPSGTAPSPITTGSKTMGADETIALVQQPDGSFAFCTPTGFYLSLNPGDGVNAAGAPMGWVYAVGSTATQFTFKRVPPPGH